MASFRPPIVYSCSACRRKAPWGPITGEVVFCDECGAPLPVTRDETEVTAALVESLARIEKLGRRPH